MPHLNDRFIIYALYGDRLYVSQKKALLLIPFKEQNAHTFPLLFMSKRKRNALYKIRGRNCLCTSKYVNNKLSLIFNSWFIFLSSYHSYETSFATKGRLETPTITQQHIVMKPLLIWPQNHGIILSVINTFSPNKL